jgi:hypothetical protein
MAQLSAEQIAEHAYKAGFRGQSLTTAVAVAMAESSGNTNAHNGVPPDNSYGLWQVNMIGSLGPARRNEFGLKSDDQLFNPDKNAHAAYEISNHGTDFGPWSTYTDGAYKDHLAAARKAEEEVTKNHGKAPGGHPKNGGTTAPGGKTSGHGDDGAKGKGDPKGKGDGKAKGNGPGGVSPGHPASGKGKGNGPGGVKAGKVAVDPDRLHHYAQQVGKLAPGLTKASSTIVAAGKGFQSDALGGVAGDGGFTDALQDFMDVYGSRLKQAGTAVGDLGESVSTTGANYQNTEDHNTADLNSHRA